MIRIYSTKSTSLSRDSCPQVKLIDGAMTAGFTPCVVMLGPCLDKHTRLQQSRRLLPFTTLIDTSLSGIFSWVPLLHQDGTEAGVSTTRSHWFKNEVSPRQSKIQTGWVT